ncbi:NRDE family protein [Flammeovirga agarivorans]|uniref:NRDE family protein n=1 Tax=Flammeovirga agarivorans TaxID=2726742 RepID=A0A7X8SMR6_9BACT|nr:NRDE family protein [Flammeovirga agarivorans]NLR93074.1 NRDE family protein [Flammeovirga agarivorans]
MCTLTYIPLSSTSYLFTSNRDERKSRSSAFAPTIHEKNGVSFIAPIDSQALGTWLGASENSRVVCLLNGGLKAHIPTPPYKHSRGKVVIDSLLAVDIELYLTTYDFNNVEPFTLIVIENKDELSIIQFIWDGQKSYQEFLDPASPHIWSSVTLYNSNQTKKRKEKFLDWLSSSEKNAQEILEVHENLDHEDSSTIGLSMQRPQYCTVSTTQLKVTDQRVDMMYHDRNSTQKDFAHLPLTVYNHES